MEDLPEAKYPFAMQVSGDLLLRIKKIKETNREFTSAKIVEIGVIAIEARLQIK